MMLTPESIPAALAVTGEKQTRKSIKKYFPLGQIMSQGQNNPITLHSVNENVFACLWSYVAEVMVVDGELTRYTKEVIALLVSKKNECPMCCSAHRMMGAAAEKAVKDSQMTEEERKLEQEKHMQALNYAELLIVETIKYRPNQTQPTPGAMPETDDDLSLLSDGAKAEAALVVVLFFHMNTVVSAVLGEQMSRAMFSVPKSAAKRMESRSMIKLMGKIMAPFLAGGMKVQHQPGVTAKLFKEGSSSLSLLPEHLHGASLAGEERSNALERLYAWVLSYEEYLVDQNIVSDEIIKLLDNPEGEPPTGLRPSKMAHWATTEMRKFIRACLRNEEDKQDLANLLCLVSYAPSSVYNSIHWKTLTKSLGNEQAKAIVLWWSLRETLRRAHGLRK